MSDKKLLQQFVDSFQRLDDDMVALDGTPLELIVKREVDEWDSWRGDLDLWEPKRIDTNPDRLEPLYSRIAGRFPVMYEQLVLSFRWLEVDLQMIRLFANPPGVNLSGLTEAIFNDPIIADVLIPAGFVPFAYAPSGNYDALCFDLNAMTSQRDCPIIQFEHESILCDLKTGERWQRWESFRDLMTEIIFLNCK
ncbi:MAG: hypothetical protein K0U86_14700 [Planctomycetes bacterium]|nr:hypothetical protein [Planctomycetota bacterium]MCH9726146.1 hypothetical protein [Planctomycetota bacterium]MCH9775652.1 hypothetical protein [Planctomycetota bacterium]MCH9792580.1 hypothetical protein [Planctomycetota bacterium]